MSAAILCQTGSDEGVRDRRRCDRLNMAMEKWPSYPQLVEMIAAGKAYFKSDGCTDVPNFNFCACCFEHDYYYTTHIITRSEADKRLRRCISAKGWYLLPWLYWLGVRIFGRNHWNNKYDPSVYVPEEILEIEHDDFG